MQFSRLYSRGRDEQSNHSIRTKHLETVKNMVLRSEVLGSLWISSPYHFAVFGLWSNLLCTVILSSHLMSYTFSCSFSTSKTAYYCVDHNILFSNAIHFFSICSAVILLLPFVETQTSKIYVDKDIWKSPRYKLK